MDDRHTKVRHRKSPAQHATHTIHGADASPAAGEANRHSQETEGLLALLRGARDGEPQTHVEHLLRGLLDFSPDAVVIVAPDGRIELVNGQTEALFGYPREELIGQPVEILIPQRFHAGHVRYRSEYTSNPRTRPMGAALQLLGTRKDGSEFPVEVSLSPLQIRGGELVIGTIRDVTERKALEAALRESERRAHEDVAARLSLLQTILDEIPVGIYLVRGADARLVLANRAVPAMWGAVWPEGRPLEAFLAEVQTRVFGMSGRELAGEELATLRAVRTRETVRQQQEVLRHRDGTTLPVLVSAIPLDLRVLRHEGDAATSTDEPVALVVHQDVTALRDAERLKDEFVAMAAHELRNPMGTLSVYGSMLRRETPTRAMLDADVVDWQVEALEGIEQATKQLVSLTDDLLDVTKLQAGGFWMQVDPYDLAALLRRVVQRIQKTTERHRIRLIGADEILIVAMDVRRMDQVVTNLLNNAIKYTPKGGEIVVTLKRVEDEGQKFVELTVLDHGMGIPLEDQPRIFSRFARGTNARAGQIEGTGLGLYLCRELVERQGGRIWFTSTEGAGSTFSLRLPEWSGEES